MSRMFCFLFPLHDCTTKKPDVLGLILLAFYDVVSKLWRHLGPTNTTRAHHVGLSIIRYFLPFIGNTVCVQYKRAFTNYIDKTR